jgi:hypothetical protein
MLAQKTPMVLHVQSVQRPRPAFDTWTKEEVMGLVLRNEHRMNHLIEMMDRQLGLLERAVGERTGS